MQKKYIIERNIPGAGKLTPDELKGITQKSCYVLHEFGPKINWVHSYVNADKVYCVYVAPNSEMIRTHAEKGTFPADRISEVTAIINPTTAD
jgi:Nickel responsive protein SCO4226-like